MEFMQRLKSGEVMVADGATGTFLHQAGLPTGTAPELWNAEQPDKVGAMHRAYIDAGADIILTNTFGGSRRKLDRFGLSARTPELNQAAAVLAKKVAGGVTLVAGDIGPMGELLEPLGPVSYDEAVQVFAEQARALAEGGADFILVESMSALEEATAAVEGAKSVTDLPLVCSMSFESHGRTMMGVRPAQMLERLWPLGCVALGVNCGRSLGENEAALKALHEAQPGIPLWAKPNAGLPPRLEGGRTVWDVGPQEFAVAVSGWVGLGARVVGGCCGTTPAHIRALRDALQVGA